MDPNLEDSLNLESEMGTIDFDPSGVVVNQGDIITGTDIPMEYEQIEEEPILMDTGNEEIIDLMGQQFTLQGYSMDDQQSDSNVIIDGSLQGLGQSETMIDLQFAQETVTEPAVEEVITQPKYIAIKAAQSMRTVKKGDVSLATVPRQVAIAPKPPKLQVQKAYTQPKQFAIAPKPGNLVVVNKSGASLVKPLPVTTVQSSGKPNTVLAQIGKHMVMVPAGVNPQKIKIVPSGSGLSAAQAAQLFRTSQPQLVAAKNTNMAKPVMTKVLVQQSAGGAEITKLVPATSRYVMQQKTVPISIGGGKVMLSPKKQMYFSDKQRIINIAGKSPTAKLITTSTSASTTKKIVITANPQQNVILKTTAPTKTGSISQEGKFVMQKEPQRTQLHQINVPGKGIQYIRLVTSQPPQKPAPKSAPIMLTDNKGNLIQMTAEKMVSGQPPPLVFTGSVVSGAGNAKTTMKPQKKLVRIAPVTTKAGPSTSQPPRSAQSLLAPLPAADAVTLEEFNDLVDRSRRPDTHVKGEASPAEEEGVEPESMDSKEALRALIADTIGHGDLDVHNMQEVEVEHEPRESEPDEDSSSSMDTQFSKDVEHPLIVIPSNYQKQDSSNNYDDDSNQQIYDTSNNMSALVNVEGEALPYLSPTHSLPHEDSETVPNELGLRPRKACNCTKSQCLKLYCDCFANGEFCNNCNCNNCHNNLQNEELRQKVIRACLDRNPHAFRPKIGKAKNGGADLIRRHNKGCNCKRSGCLKNYCECYEAKIACTSMCKCVGCRNVEETLERRRDSARRREHAPPDTLYRPPTAPQVKQPCSFLTNEVISAVCQCLLAAAAGGDPEPAAEPDPVADVIGEFARCLQDVIGAAHRDE